MNKYLLFFLFQFLFLAGIVNAANIDSLLKVVLNKKLPDSIRMDAEHSVVNELVYSDPQLALKNILILEKSLRKENKKAWMADLLWKKGIAYREINDVKKASATLFDALDLAREIKDVLQEAKIYNSLGSMYFSQGDIDHSEEMFKKSYAISLKENNKAMIADCYINFSGIAEGRKDMEECVFYSKKALKIYQELGDRDGEAYVFTNIGRSFEESQKYDSAIFYYEKALTIFEEYKNNRGISTLLINLGVLHYDNKNINGAKEYCQRAYKLTKEMHLDQVRKSACNCLYKSYKETDLKKAIFYLEEFHAIKDSLMDEQSIAENTKREEQFKYKETAMSDSLKRESKKEKEDAETKLKHEQEVGEQKLYTYFGIGIAFVAIAFLIFVYRGLRQKKRANLLLEEKNSLIQKQKKDVETQKLIIEEKHKEINDSINYAERLQRSLMASKDLLIKNLPDYFIYFNPKESVSGDFYWATELNNGNFLLACADSTGHGVPGAMMSIMNMNSLKETVKEGFTLPADIFNHTRKLIIETLANDGSKEGGKDGMDAILLSFDFKNLKLNFSLANNPLWIIRQNELLEFSPDKMPVGKHDKQDISFTNHEINLLKGDLIIAFTDGFADQFGGEKGKKFKYSGLKNILLENSNSKLEDLHNQLSISFEKWKGDLEQVDDVCIIGIRI